MKTYGELNRKGTAYLSGYTEALKDLACAIGRDDPDLYNCSTLELLTFLNEYMSGLLKKVGGEDNAAK